MPARDLGIDAIRAFAMFGLVVGHWLVTAFAVVPGQGLVVESPLAYLGQLTPLTWVLQTLALFFFAGGFASARRQRSRYSRWLGRRLAGFGRHLTPLIAFWAVTLCGLALLGVPNSTLALAAKSAFGPLWFLGVYVVLLAAAPLVGRLERAIGWWAVLPPLSVVAAGDLSRYGPLPETPESLTYLSVPAGWLVPFQLGHALANGRLDHRRHGPIILATGVLGAAALLGLANYPASMVGITGIERSNLNPVSLLAVMVGLIQIGLFCVLRIRIGRIAAKAETGIRVTNGVAMPVYLWHQSALVLVVLGFGASGVAAAGLTGAPDTAAWVFHRLAWFPVFALVLALARRLAGNARSRSRQSCSGVP